MDGDGALAFVDTNVLLYAYDASEAEKHQRAADLVGELGTRRVGALSIQVLQEFYVNATRKIARPLAPAAAVDRVRALGRWRTHAPTPHDVIAAAELAQDQQLSFWDAMIVRSAMRLGCETLWSEDLSDGQRIGGVVARNPFAG